MDEAATDAESTDAAEADAMLDRIMQNHHRLTLAGESLRKTKPQAKQEDAQA